MKKFGVYAITAVGATAVSMAVLGTGIAAADDYSGQTYSDASQAISDAGKTAVIASRAGDTLADDDCIVTQEILYECGCRSIQHEYHDGSVSRRVVRHDGRVLVDEMLSAE